MIVDDSWSCWCVLLHSWASSAFNQPVTICHPCGSIIRIISSLTLSDPTCMGTKPLGGGAMMAITFCCWANSFCSWTPSCQRPQVFLLDIFLASSSHLHPFAYLLPISVPFSVPFQSLSSKMSGSFSSSFFPSSASLLRNMPLMGHGTFSLPATIKFGGVLMSNILRKHVAIGSAARNSLKT